MNITWEDYLNHLLSETPELTGINISPSRDTYFSSKLSTVSVLLREQFASKSNHNIFIFPDFKYTFPSFVFLYVLHAIISDKIQSSYNQAEFQVGEILKVGKAYVKYLGKATEKDAFVKLQFSDTIVTKQQKDLPLFQKAKDASDIKLSSFARYKKELASKNLADSYLGPKPALHLAMDLKTHLTSSVLVITSRSNIKSAFLNYALDRVPVRELFLMGEAKIRNSSGSIEVENINLGKLGGIPAIIFAYDSYVASELLRDKSNKITSIIIDNSEFSNKLEFNFFDCIDKSMPITCISSYAAATDLSIYFDQQYNCWSWSNEFLPPSIKPYSLLNTPCALNEVQFTSLCSPWLDQVLLHLRQVDKDALTRSLSNVYSRLFSIFWKAIRLVTVRDEQELTSSKKLLDQYKKALVSEKNLIENKTYSHLEYAVNQLNTTYVNTEISLKVKEISSLLLANVNKSVVIVVDTKCDIKQIRRYWYKWLRENHLPDNDLSIEYSSDYLKLDSNYDLTIVCGWYKEVVMRDVLLNLKSKSCIVLMYGCETFWKDHYFSNLATKLSKVLQNNELISNYCNTPEFQVAVPESTDNIAQSSLSPSINNHLSPNYSLPSFSELEAIRREAEYRAIEDSNNCSDEVITTVPVDFYGSVFAYYRKTHSLLCVTDILQGKSNCVQTLKPADLHQGDFIAVRLTDKNQLRDLADSALQNQSNSYRENASLWRSALKRSIASSSVKSLYSAMQIYGFTKSKQTFILWLNNDDLIGPQDKKDLKILAKATKDQALTARLDECWDAIRYIRSMHAKAGNYLSDVMEEKLSKILSQHCEIDPNNFSGIHTIDIPNVGPVQILKVLDVGDEFEVRVSTADRLLKL